MSVGEEILWDAYHKVMSERWKMRQVYPKGHQVLTDLGLKADTIIDEVRRLREGTERELQETHKRA